MNVLSLKEFQEVGYIVNKVIYMKYVLFHLITSSRPTKRKGEVMKLKNIFKLFFKKNKAPIYVHLDSEPEGIIKAEEGDTYFDDNKRIWYVFKNSKWEPKHKPSGEISAPDGTYCNGYKRVNGEWKKLTDNQTKGERKKLICIDSKHYKNITSGTTYNIFTHPNGIEYPNNRYIHIYNDKSIVGAYFKSCFKII